MKKFIEWYNTKNGYAPDNNMFFWSGVVCVIAVVVKVLQITDCIGVYYF